jgi:hypothetical protein
MKTTRRPIGQRIAGAAALFGLAILTTASLAAAMEANGEAKLLLFDTCRRVKQSSVFAARICRKEVSQENFALTLRAMFDKKRAGLSEAQAAEYRALKPLLKMSLFYLTNTPENNPWAAEQETLNTVFQQATKAADGAILAALTAEPGNEPVISKVTYDAGSKEIRITVGYVESRSAIQQDRNAMMVEKSKIYFFRIEVAGGDQAQAVRYVDGQGQLLAIARNIDGDPYEEACNPCPLSCGQ